MKKKRKRTKSKSSNAKDKIFLTIAFIIAVLVITFGFWVPIQFGQKYDVVYEGDLTITEPLGVGLTVPDFSAKKGDIMHIYITDFYSNQGYSLVVSLQGAGEDWRVVVKENSDYNRIFEENSVYNLELAINNLSPKTESSINLHLKVVLT